MIGIVDIMSRTIYCLTKNKKTKIILTLFIRLILLTYMVLFSVAGFEPATFR